MKLLRMTALFLAIFVLITAFAGCGKADDTASDTSNGSTIETTGPSLTVVGGEFDFNIIKPENCTTNEQVGSTEIFKAYKELGATLGNRTDDSPRREDTCEILIGNTNRPETAEAKQLLIENTKMYAKNFIVCVLNDNIVIYAVTDDYLPDAIKHYLENYATATSVPANLQDIQQDTATYTTLSIGGNTNLYGYSIVRSHFETSYMTQIELESLHKFLLEKTGYYVPIVEDAYVAPGDKEIIIGGCNREGQTVDERDLGFYEIKTVGSKLYINGGSDFAVALALKELSKKLSSGTTELNDGILLSGDYYETIETYDDSEYKLVWSDEFNGTAINESVWHICYGTERHSGSYEEGKLSYRCTKENTFVKDGALYMCAMRDEKAYYGGMLHTDDDLHYKYGYLEIKAKTPDGPGFWSGFWTFGYDWNGGYTDPDYNLYAEFDIMENYGNGNYFSPALHRWPTAKGEAAGYEHTNPTYQGKYAESGGRRITCPDGKTFSDDFHTYGCYWTDEKIIITCDGLVRVELDTTLDNLDKEAFNTYNFIILSLSVYAKRSPATPNATDEQWENSNKYIIDYIRLYQNDECFIKWL